MTDIELPPGEVMGTYSGTPLIRYTADQMHIYAVKKSAVDNAELRERVRVLEDALRMALDELDELPVWSNTGRVCNAARAALGDTK